MPVHESRRTTAPERPPRVMAGALVAALCLCVAAAPAAAAKKKPRAYTVKATSGALTLTFTAKVWATLNSSAGTSAGKNASAAAPATVTAPGDLSFPITLGSLNSVTGRGSVSASGGLTIESHLSFGGLFTSSSSSSVNSPVASLGATSKVTVSSPSLIPSSGVSLFRLNTFHMKVVGSRHSVSLTKIPAKLTAAGALFFGPGFAAGQQVGAITIQIKG
jgi:hypothetical protein